MNDWLSYKASGSAKNEGYITHSRSGSKNDPKVSRTYDEMFKTIVSAGEKIRDNYKQMTGTNPKDVKSLTDAKKLITSSSKLYSYIAENSNANLPDPASGWVSKAEFYMNESIEFFGDRCVYITNMLRNEKTSIEKQRDKFTNAQIRSNYDRRIDALNQSIKTVENMKSEVEGLKHSFEDDSEYLEHWGVKGMKWGHHNQQEEKQSEANKRLEEASVVLSMKTIHERSCKDLEKSQDEHGRAIAEYENKLNTFERALDAYNKAKPEQKDGMYNALQTVWGQLEKADKNLRSAEDSLRHDAEVVKQQLDDVRKANLSPESEREAENALHDVQSKHGIWNYKITLGQIDKRNPMVERHNYLRARFNTIKDSKGAKHVYN